MVLWVFGYGSLIWKAGFHYDDRLIGFIKGYHRVFYQGSTDHRGTPEYPGRTVTLEPCDGEVCYLEVREKQYDMQEPDASTPAVSGILVYIASPDKKLNKNYLGPASMEEMANQIVHAEGPSGPNRDYVFQLEKALLKLGCEDKHVMELAETVRQKLSGRELTNSQVE
ncbi:gamma-glutamylcyclotransferase 2-3 isoform X6 [Macadamia integrifolia]|uniref:gamma-glutamylcyclotransferase 2-3 isoform X6 n=1 Tax=Macadamia integrifolia TaxID=60698 RepID=UPI001C4F088C|nr:gamma-glutamylcyclotransferase 2-3 isoform X6 [Macadamia integrifolia]